MSQTVLYTINKDKELGNREKFSNGFLYGQAIIEVLFSKYGKKYSILGSSEKDWDELESKILSFQNFDDKVTYFSLAGGFFHLKDKEKVGNAIISFSKNNTFSNDSIKKRMTEVGQAMKSIEDDNEELFGLCINTVNNYVEDAFTTGYDIFLKHAEEEFPGEDDLFYERYYEKMREEYNDRKMYDDDTNYYPLQVVNIDDNNRIIIEDLNDYYCRQKNSSNIK